MPQAPGGPDAALAAGQILERADRFKEAESEYHKALGSSSPVVRAEALRCFRRVVEARKRWLPGFVSSTGSNLTGAIGRLVWPLLLILLIFGYVGLVRFLRRLGWRRDLVEVRGWSATAEAWKGEHFRALVATILHRMKPRGMLLVQDSKLPFLIQAWSEYMGMIKDLLPASAGNWFDSLALTLLKPEYSIGGSLQTVSEVVDVIVHLERWGTAVEVWEVTCGEVAALDNVKDCVYQALIAVKQGRGRVR